MAAEADSGAAPPPGSDAVGLDLGLPDRVLLVTGPTAAGKTEIAIALAEELDHHPNIAFTWGKVEIRIWTHAIDGLSEGDFVLAAKIDRGETVN